MSSSASWIWWKKPRRDSLRTYASGTSGFVPRSLPDVVVRPATTRPSAPTTPRGRRRGRAEGRVCVLVMQEYCRSPLAQGVFEDVLEREGLAGEVSVDSAG